MHPLLPLRCVPQDFVNPFPQYRLTVTLCAVLLVAAAFVLGWTQVRRGAASPARAARLAVIVPTLFVLIVAGWVWLQSFLWLPPCGLAPFGTDWRFGLQDADQHIIPPLVILTLIVTVVALILAAALALTRLLPRDGRSAMQH